MSAGPIDPAHAPAGHRVGLGDAVDDDRLVDELGDLRGHRREHAVAVHQVLVDLVGHDPDTVGERPLTDGTHLGGGVHDPGRVGRADEQERLRPVGARGIELIDGHLEASAVGAVDDDRDTARERDGLGVGRPVRGRQEDLVVRVEERREGGEHRVLPAIGHQHLRCVVGDPEIPEGLGDDRRAQLWQAAGRRVLVVPGITAGLDRDLHDPARCREVRLPCPEADDILAGSLECLGLGVDEQCRG